MSRIRSTNTKPEVLLRTKLFTEGFRYRINDKRLPGKPYIVLEKYRTVIFVHGCFWHGHQHCRHFVVSKTRTEFWFHKFSSGDLRNNKALMKLEWKIITLWTCEQRDDHPRTKIYGQLLTLSANEIILEIGKKVVVLGYI